jgi:hypothetical protein
MSTKRTASNRGMGARAAATKLPQFCVFQSEAVGFALGKASHRWKWHARALARPDIEM